jgi:hypothetical protein
MQKGQILRNGFALIEKRNHKNFDPLILMDLLQLSAIRTNKKDRAIAEPCLLINDINTKALTLGIIIF